MKKIIGLLIFGLFLLFSGNSLFADAFDDCFELERLKAKSDGLGAVESAEQASKICRAKLGGSQSQGNTTQNNNLADDSKSGGFASIGVLSGVAIKGGYKFKNGRIHYTNHAAPLNDDDFKTITAGILGFDYIANGGFMIGIGTGNATSPDAREVDLTSNTCVPESFRKNYRSSTSASSFNIGWLQNKKGFQYGFYLFAVTFADPLLSENSFCDSSGYSVKTLLGFGGLKAEFGFVF